MSIEGFSDHYRSGSLMITRFRNSLGGFCGDGIRGCWGDRKMTFVNEAEMWSVQGLMENVKMHEDEWKMEGSDLVALYRSIPGHIY
jgi:hypothetical protein